MILNDVKKIGIIKLGSIGDIIHTLPAVHALRSRFPEAGIDWIVEKKSLEILTGNRCIDNIVVIDTKAWRKSPLGKATRNSIMRIFRYLNDASYDLVFDFQGLIKSGVLTYLTGAPRKIGFNIKDCREKMNRIFMNMNAPAAGNKTHVIDKNLNILKFIDIDVSRVQFPFSLRNGDELPIDDFIKKYNLSDKDFIVVIDPSAGWETKCLDISMIARIIDYLILKQGVKVVLMWGPGEYEKAVQIKVASKSEPYILCKTSLKNLAAFLRRCDMMISPDTGPMHLAAALGVQCIGIYGPTCPYKNGPFGEKNLFVSRFVDCAPCYKRSCDDLKCMNSITFEDIKEKIDIALK